MSRSASGRVARSVTSRGVVNQLAEAGESPILVTTAPVPTICPDVEIHVRSGRPSGSGTSASCRLGSGNDVVVGEAIRAVAGRRVSMVYQRYSLHNFAGLRLAHHLRVPFVLEYNGSEVWMSRHWGRPLKYEALAERIERVNVCAADLVVVVSRPMRDDLIARGVPGDRILVNPNAVDPETYRPDLDGAAVRSRLAFGSKTVVGFISTFQPWHGAEVLAAAFAILIRDHPEYPGVGPAADVVGDGPRPGAVETSPPATPRLDDLVACVGLVPAGGRAALLSQPAMCWCRPTCRTLTARRSSAHRPSCSSTWRWAKASSPRTSIRSARCCATVKPRGWYRPAIRKRWRLGLRA